MSVQGGFIERDGVEYYRIDGIEAMDPFFTTVVSDDDLWMFVSSTGALTAGRRNADGAFLGYQTEDRLHRSAEIAGPVTIIARESNGNREVWTPFGFRLTPGCTRSISKSIVGDRLVFEERHRAWGATFRAVWGPSRELGWVRSCELTSDAGGEFEILDGLLDVMPPGIGAGMEQATSNLADAYKRSEVVNGSSMAVYALESLISDRAEPAEALMATLVWSYGDLGEPALLDEREMGAMRAGHDPVPVELLTGRAGAYLLRDRVQLDNGPASWSVVVDTGLDHANLAKRRAFAEHADRAVLVEEDLAAGTQRLTKMLADTDGFQRTADRASDAHHTSNVLFNSMRGGTFRQGYHVDVNDFLAFLRVRSRPMADRHGSAFADVSTIADLRTIAESLGDPHLLRLVLEYLPLTFSRRHGDPSRPWNQFSIEVRNEDGTDRFYYEGNWRDIFQNWEALLLSFPELAPQFVSKFVNASTVDGHNPYRITSEGVDWEVPEPHDPWSNIGYWGDHQIVYLSRLLDQWQRFEPEEMAAWLIRRIFTYADVPYVLSDFKAAVADPRNTVAFDRDHQSVIEQRVHQVGTDGRLVVGADGQIVMVGLMEKLLVPALAKLSNLAPGGGIWINTQRPEWNDANNALAGYGLSMVTLFHLRRYLAQLKDMAAVHETYPVSRGVADWMSRVGEALDSVDSPVDDVKRRRVMEALGAAASGYRGERDFAPTTVEAEMIGRLCDRALVVLDAVIGGARRPDGLFESYNLVSFPSASTARVDHLGPMLEGQVAALSSGVLDPEAACGLLEALFASDMYRDDQNSFMLYPVVERPAFADRNRIESVPAFMSESGLLVESDDGFHFRSDFINQAALERVLSVTHLDERQREAITDLYEETFQHHGFTGRSGAMHGYEGIGSIYWHMVSKLLVAVQEILFCAHDSGSEHVHALTEFYQRIRQGLGFQKSPETWGAFPNDCYSHTPAHAGAQQPGMTGQVKEEILTRLGEFGLRIVDGRISMSPLLHDATDIFGPENTTATFSFCAVPFSVRSGDTSSVAVRLTSGELRSGAVPELTVAESRAIFARSGTISGVEFVVS